MTFHMILSGPGNQSIALNKNITKSLESYKKDTVRFVYNSYVSGQPGAILNVDLDMFHEHACAVALNALYKRGQCNMPSVVLCNEEMFQKWYYFVKNYAALEVYRFSKDNADQLLSRNEALVLIVTDAEHANLRNYVKDFQFFCLLIDKVDTMCNKLIMKQIQAEYHLGITHKNFMTDPDQLMQWKIINWALKKSNKQFLQLPDFIKYDNDYLKLHIDPYSSFWHVVTWNFWPPSDIESNETKKAELLRKIQRCTEAHGFAPRTNQKSPQGSRQRVSQKRTIKRRRKVIMPENDSAEYWSSDDDTCVDLSVFEAKPNNQASPPSDAGISPKGLKLKSPKRRVKPIDTFNSTFVGNSRKKLDFEDATSSHKHHMAVSPSNIIDKAVINEFSLPFEKNPAPCTRNTHLSTSQSEVAELSKVKETACMIDVNVHREFSQTDHIVFNANTAPTVTSTQEVVHNLHLVLSANSDQDKSACSDYCELPSAQNQYQGSISSDEDIDNYMIRLLDNIKQTTQVMEVASNFLETSMASEEENAFHQRLLSGSENFLTNIMNNGASSCNFAKRTMHNENVISNGDSPEENFLIGFL